MKIRSEKYTYLTKMSFKTIYITLLDGYCSSYFMEEYTQVLIKPTFLTFQYSGTEYKLLNDLHKNTFSPMNFQAYQNWKDHIESVKTFNYVIPTFEEIWSLIISEIISKSIRELEKYYYEPSKIIFTISESYKFHGIFDIVIDVISRFASIYPNIEFTHINYSNVIENSMIKDYYINIGAEKINPTTEKQIHSFFEIGLNSTIIYTIKIKFETKNNLTYPSKTKILEKTIIPIGIISPFIELFGDISKTFEDQEVKFMCNINENITKILQSLNLTESVYFIDNEDNRIKVTLDDFKNTTLSKTIITELERIDEEYNPLTIKQISYSTLTFLTEEVLSSREGNGTHEGSFYATGYINLIYDGIYTTNRYTSYRDFRPLSEFFEVPLVDFDLIRIIPQRFIYDEVLNYFENQNKKFQHCLSIKSKIQNETFELCKLIDADSEIRKAINSVKKIIDTMSANDGEKYYELWCQFKRELLN